MFEYLSLSFTTLDETKHYAHLEREQFKIE